MRKLAPLLLALALAGSVALQPTEPALKPLAQLCPYEGWPGGAYSYCVAGDPTLIATSWLVPDGTVLYEHCATPARYGERLVLQPHWLELRTRELRPMPEGELWHFRPTEASHCDRRRFPVAWPGDLWMPDLAVVPQWLHWVPLVAG